MLSILQDLVQKIEAAIDGANTERALDGQPEFRQVVIRLLGQFGLLVHPHASLALKPVATRDIDALLSGDQPALWLVRAVINQSGYAYDDLSREIWLPTEAQFETLYESRVVKVEVVAPVFNLLSKAKKAPERNRNLIVKGLAVYGAELMHLLTAHGVDIDYFLKEESP